ncbi:MAG: phospholipase D-like domain-containing protein [Thermoplasmatota archaeon]
MLAPVELLFDNESVFSEVVRMVRAAKRGLHLSQLYFDPAFVASFDPDVSLAREVHAAAERGVRVRILVEHFPFGRFAWDSLVPLQKWLERTGNPGERIEIHGFRSLPNILHAKLLIADGEEALFIGSPFKQEYWDSPAHHVPERRRGKLRATHDMGAKLHGPLAADADRFFASLWNMARVGALAPMPLPDAGAAVDGVTLVRSMASRQGEGIAAGVEEIRDALCATIESARERLFIETQYFTSPLVTRALRNALERSRDLRVVIVLNERMDVPGYRSFQRHRLEDVGWPGSPRVAAFSLWKESEDGGRRYAEPVYVHARFVMADGQRALLGGGNLDGLSLGQVTALNVPVPPNYDVSIALDASRGPGAAWVGAPLAAAWDRLEREHLGEPAPRDPEAWINRWQEVAISNLDSLRSGRHRPRLRGQILPYAVQDRLLHVE